MPKIERKTRWTAQELKEHYSRPLSRFYSPKQKQQHNLFAKYVNEGKFTDRRVLRDNAVNLGKGVRTQQVINGLHPNVPGAIKTTKLGRVKSKATGLPPEIEPVKDLRGFVTPGIYPQSNGQRNFQLYNREKEQVIGVYDKIKKTREGEKRQASVYLYPNYPSKAQDNDMYEILEKKPRFTDVTGYHKVNGRIIPEGEKTISFNKRWQKEHRDTFDYGRKMIFKSEKEKFDYIDKTLRGVPEPDFDKLKPHHSRVKRINRLNEATDKQYADIVTKLQKIDNIRESEKKEKYGE